MEAKPLSPDGQRLTAHLKAARQHAPKYSGHPVHVTGVGGHLYFAYEQLRNAAEYSERHLLLRRAIERFLRRSLNLNRPDDDLGTELVTELTQARYIQNDTIHYQQVKMIEEIMARYAKLFGAVRQNQKLPSEQLKGWILQAASVEIEHQLVDQSQTDAFLDFAFNHYLEHMDREEFGAIDEVTFEAALYVAVHRTLFKSDMATIRYYALVARLGPQGLNSIDYFVILNRLIDQLNRQPLTNRLSRLVNRHAAPLRILREVIMATNEPETVLAKPGELSSRVASEAGKQYKLARQRLNDGIVRSVAFIFITKVLIGISIEVPYDLVSRGAVSWVPLIINLVFPPAYMATIGLGLRTPGRRNTEVIQSYVERIVYEGDDPPLRYRLRRRSTKRQLRGVFNFVYFVAFAISFSLLVYVLQRIGYNIVNGIIFFVFLSAVSFFGYRLQQTARELDAVEGQQSLITVLFDFFYTPFIRVGHWLSDSYARINLVTFILDLAIELPLKTSLRVVRQWVGFIRDKQEDL
jgi:hypothetical protein